MRVVRARLGHAALLERPPDRTRSDQQQHDARQHPVVTLVADLHLGLEARAGQSLALLLAAGGHVLAGERLFPLQPLALVIFQLGEAAASGVVGARSDAVGAQERDDLSIRDGEEELRIRSPRIGTEAVDAEHAPASVQQRPARIAARDGRGVEHGVEIAAGPHSGKKTAALHRGLAPEDIPDLQPLRPVDIHRIADREGLAAVRNRPARHRKRWQAQSAGDAQQSEVAARIGGDDLGIARIRAVRRHDPDPQAVIHHRVAHDVGVGHDPVGRDRPAGSVADRKDLRAIGRILRPDDDHAHHAACGGVDIGGLGQRRGGQRRKKGADAGGKGEKASHRPGLTLRRTLTASFGMRSLPVRPNTLVP